MPKSMDRTRYIPFRKRDIVEMVLDDGGFKSVGEAEKFRLVCSIIESIFHFEFHELLETLKDVYYPINPDINNSVVLTVEEKDRANSELVGAIQKVLNDANFDKLSESDLERAWKESALVGINVDIDMSTYDFLQVYVRGRRQDKITISKFYGLKKIEAEDEILERVLIMARVKPEVQKGTAKGKETLADSDSTIIKLFKDVPLKDLEILFPNSRIVMSMKDKLLLGIPAVAGGVPLLATKVVPAVIAVFLVISAWFGVKGSIDQNMLKQAVAALAALGALGGYLFKQWSKYKTKKLHFQKEISDNLYFRNLVNNAGVFYSLIDAAEEEESKEAFLAYYFLYTAEKALTENELDGRVEKWLEEKHGCVMDFECADALAKLDRLNILERNRDKTLAVSDMDSTLKILDTRWDNYFQYSV